MNIIQSDIQSISPTRSLSDTAGTSGISTDPDGGDQGFSQLLSDASVFDDKSLNSNDLIQGSELGHQVFSQVLSNVSIDVDKLLGSKDSVQEAEVSEWTALTADGEAIIPVASGLVNTEIDSELVVPNLPQPKLISGSKLPGSGIGLPESESVTELLPVEVDYESNLINTISYQQQKGRIASPAETEMAIIKLKGPETEPADILNLQRRSSSIQGQSLEPGILSPRQMTKEGFELPGFINQETIASQLRPDEMNTARLVNTSSFVALRPALMNDPVMTSPIQNMVLNPQGDARVWGEGLGERVNWMINQKLNNATIRLDPPSLGKLEVHINFSTDSTTVTINTHQAQTREMVENASHRLRDILEENGFANVNVDVSHHQQGGSEDDAHRDNFEQLHSDDSDKDIGSQSDPSIRTGSTLINRLIDFFA
jgi:hypothetical protein